jgi:hypothetical protein
LREDDVHPIVTRALRSGFFAPPGVVLRLSHDPRRAVAWETLGGHLLDQAQTRKERTFASWEVSLASAANSAGPQPLLAVFWEEPRATFHVIRYLRVHGWEAYEAEPSVILSRPVEKQARELVGTILLTGALDADDVCRRLQRLVFQALVGTRLPVTSWESPLPAFQLGQCAYLPGLSVLAEGARGDLGASAAGEATIPVLDSPEELLRRSLVGAVPLVVQAKALEAALRASDAARLPSLAAILVERRGSEPVAGVVKPLLIALFHHVALTPYTRFADNLIALLRLLAERSPVIPSAAKNLARRSPRPFAALRVTLDRPEVGVAAIADVIGYMLRHLVRHLTAFDLRTFHNRGANYPDALLLDGLLKTYVELIDRDAQQFADLSGDDAPALAGKRRRRRALRQAWIVRKAYEGLKVPRTPTSPGDLQRVLPAQYAAANEDEVLDPAKRRKTLFADDPLERRLTPSAQTVLEASLGDLDHPLELRELGLASFLDRPLGIAKRPGEVDRTPLLTYEAMSCGVAQQRLAALCRGGLLDQARRDALIAQLQALTVQGYTGHHGRLPTRPGTPCLEDANLAASDFVFLRTTRGSLDEFLGCFDWSRVRSALPDEHEWLTRGRDVLLVRVAAHTPRSGKPLLAVFDSRGTERWTLCLPDGNTTVEYVEEDGCERLAGGLMLKPAAPFAEPAAAAATAIALPASRPACWPRLSSDCPR